MGLSTYFHVILFVLRRFDWRTQGCLLRFRCLARFFFWWWCAGFAEFHRFLIAVIMFHSLVLIVGVPLAGHTDRRPRCSRRRVPFRRRPLRTKKKVINEKKQKDLHAVYVCGRPKRWLGRSPDFPARLKSNQARVIPDKTKKTQ